MQNLNDKLTHNEFSAELVEDRHGMAIMISQIDGDCDGPCSVLLHPWQLRAVCENFGVLTADKEAHKTIAMLTRRLLVMRDRADHIAQWLANDSDTRHTDLTYEQTYSRASADIADEFCFELGTVVQGATPAPTAKPATSPQAALI